jgi:cystathionine beta-lyase
MGLSTSKRYDFETILNRFNIGSAKWEDMRRYGVTENSGIVPMSNAEMEFPIPPEVEEGLCQFIHNGSLSYFRPVQSYYDAVVDWMKRRHDWDIQQDWIIPFPGISGALSLVLEVLTEPGDGIIVMPPTWPGFFHIINSISRTRVDNPLIKTSDSYEIDFDDLERKAKDPETKVLFFCSPHNPVGRVWTRDELERVGDICLENGVVIVSDEIHCDLIMPGYRHIPFAAVSPQLADSVITCGAPSKTFNLAGLFTSHIIAADEGLRQKVQERKSRIGILRPNLLGMKACELAYNFAGGWLDQCLAKVLENSEYVKAYLSSDLPMLKIDRLEGSYLMWMDLNGLGLGHEELDQGLMRDAHVFFDGGHFFGEEGRGYQRVNVACPTKAVEATMGRLGQWVKTLG